MDEMFGMMPGEQMKLLQSHVGGDAALLTAVLEGICNTLVMGFEEYLRAFDPQRGIDGIIDAVTKGAGDSGDVRTMALRGLALVLEHVPNSTATAARHSGLLALALASLRSARRCRYEQTTPVGLAEETLRVLLALSQADANGLLASPNAIVDIVGCLDWCDLRTSRQALEVLTCVCRAMPLPPSSYPAAPEAPAKAKTPAPKPSPGSGSQLLTGAATERLVKDISERVLPALTSVIATFAASSAPGVPLSPGAAAAAAAASSGGSSSAANDRWSTVEGACLCILALARRATALRSPVIGAIASPAVLGALLDILQGPEAAVDARRDFVLTTLAALAPCNQSGLGQLLLRPGVSTFLRGLLRTTDRDVASLLDDPFGRRVASDSRTLTPSQVLALQLVSGAVAALPVENRCVRFAVLPLHEWSWEDDMHAFSKYSDDNCMLIETAYHRGDASVDIKVQGAGSYRVDLVLMRQTNPRGGVARGVRRSHVAKSFFVWEDATATEGSSPGTKSSGKKSKESLMAAAGPCSFFHPEPLTAAEGARHIEFLSVYLPIVLPFAVASKHEVLKALCALSVAQCLLACLPTPSKGADSFVSVVSANGAGLCEFLADGLSLGDDCVVDCSLLVLDLLLHHHGGEWRFLALARRFGLYTKLSALCSGTGNIADPAVSPTAARALFLRSACDALRSRDESPSPLTRHTSLFAAVQAFATGTPDFQKAFLPELLACVGEGDATTTPFEFAESGVAIALLDFISCVQPANKDKEALAASSGGDAGASNDALDETTSGSGPTDPAESLARQELLAQALRDAPECATALVTQLVNSLAFFKDLPDVEATTTAAAVRTRPLQQALQVMANISPNIDVCTNRPAKGQPGRDGAPVVPSNDSPDHIDRRTLCPNGHRLHRRTARSWRCDLCDRNAEPGDDVSMTCRRCDFDACMHCYMNEEVGYEGGEPRPTLGGVQAHILSPVGDVERYFRLGPSLGLPGLFGGGGFGGPELMQLEQLLQRLAAVGDRAGGGEARATLLRQLLEGVAGGGDRPAPPPSQPPPPPPPPPPAGSGRKGAPGAPAAPAPAPAKKSVGSKIPTPLPAPHVPGRAPLPASATSQVTPGGRREATTTTATDESDNDARPALVPSETGRLALHYDGLGRIDLHEPLFSMLFRKALAARIPAALDTFEAALVCPAGLASSTPARGLPQVERRRRRAAAAAAAAAAAEAAATGVAAPGGSPTAPLPSASAAAAAAPLRRTPSTPAAPAATATATSSSSAATRATPVPTIPATPATPARTATPTTPMRAATPTTPLALQPVAGSPDRASASTPQQQQQQQFRSSPRSPPELVDDAQPTHRVVSVRDLADASPTRKRTLFLHVFTSDDATRCACGGVKRHAESLLPPPRPSELENEPEVWLLGFLWRVSRGGASTAKAAAGAGIAEAGKNAVDASSPATGGAAPLIPESAFRSHGLAAKVLRSAAASALRVALLPASVALPRWVTYITHSCSFLLPLEVRTRLAVFVATGARRALWQALQTDHAAAITGPFTIVGSEWSQRVGNGYKLEVPREGLLEAAFDELVERPEARLPLSVSFAGDVGTGLGPTLQFYTKLATEFMKRSHNMWRERAVPRPANAAVATAEGSSDAAADPDAALLVDAPDEGLFPKPRPHRGSGENQNKQERTLADGETADDEALADFCRWYALGAIVARAVIDGRVFPLPLSPMMFEFVRRRDRVAAFHFADVALVDKQVASSLRTLNRLARRFVTSSSDADSAAVRSEIEAMDLVFTLPGSDDIELLPGGKDIAVTPERLAEFVTLAADALVYDTVAYAVEPFRDGFLDALPSEGMRVLSAEEWAEVVCGYAPGVAAGPLWSLDDMSACVVADHGYTRESNEVQWLIEAVSVDFTPRQQSKFLEFCTGCPRLPIGGLRTIGKITVVRKDGETTSGSDGSSPARSGGGASGTVSHALIGLPSVNTCFKYLKLPQYRTKQQLIEKVLQAMDMSGDSFDLS